MSALNWPVLDRLPFLDDFHVSVKPFLGTLVSLWTPGYRSPTAIDAMFLRLRKSGGGEKNMSEKSGTDLCARHRCLQRCLGLHTAAEAVEAYRVGVSACNCFPKSIPSTSTTSCVTCAL